MQNNELASVDSDQSIRFLSVALQFCMGAAVDF